MPKFQYIFIFSAAKVLERGERLDILVEKTDDLSKSVSTNAECHLGAFVRVVEKL